LIFEVSVRGRGITTVFPSRIELHKPSDHHGQVKKDKVHCHKTNLCGEN
ncbi:unnamed protein product, partial [Musa acuminata subsp. burmannicoides]